MNVFFAEVARTNSAYCRAHGLTDPYGTPPNAAEIEVSHLIALGVPSEAAVPRIVEKYRTGFGGDRVAMTLARLRVERMVRQTREKYRAHYPATPFEKLVKAEQKAGAA